MKIALVVRNYERRGGISRYSAELAEYLAEEHEVHVFTASWKDVRDNKIIFHKVPVLTFDFLKKRKKHALNNIFEVSSFALFSYFAVEKELYDIVHVQGDYIGKLDVYTAHSCHKAWLSIFNEENHGILERLKKSMLNPLHSILLIIESHCLRKAEKVIAVSGGVKREIVGCYGIDENGIEAIPNGVDIERFAPDRRSLSRSEIRKRHGIKDEEFVIIFPAHEFRRKGLVQILEALKILKNDKICVLIAGKDNPAFFLKHYAELKKRMIFVGEVPEIEQYYAASDIMIFPTAYEPFGLVILEAMAAGLPVITARNAGAAELIEDGKNGLLLSSPYDIEKIVRDVKHLFDNRKDVSNIGFEARRTAEKYTWEMIAEETYRLYAKMTRNGVQ